MRHPKAGLSIPLAALLAATSAEATYSVVAADRMSQQVGGAGTSCVGSLSVRIIYGVVPGVGAVHAQAQVNTAGRDEAVRLLDGGVAPAEIIARITAPTFDSAASFRQYGVVDLAARSAGYTGQNNGAVAADRQGSAGGRYVYSAQGNILTGVRVIDQVQSSFESSGCDLADRLMLALEAGAQNGEGDSRCTPSGIPSDSAFIEVDRPGEAAGSWLRLEVTSSRPASPLVELRSRFNSWRASHGCPVVSDAGAAAPDGGAGPADAGAVPSADAGSMDAGWTVDAGTPGAPRDPAVSGCSCGSGALPEAIAAVALIMLAGVNRTRRKRGTLPTR